MPSAGEKPGDICLIGVGARTPLGLNARASAAAVFAGVAAFADHPYMIDRHGLPMVVARDAVLPEEAEGLDRLLGLVLPALQEGASPLAGQNRAQTRVPLLLGLSAERPGQEAALAARLADRLPGAFHGPVPLSEVVTFPSGHCAGLLALREAARRLAQEEAEVCLVAGVDSYHEPRTLEWLDDQEQLKSEHHVWGFTPGEAAGACLLSTRRLAQRQDWMILGSVVGTGSAVEENRIHTDTVCLGRGLTEAIRDALAPLAETGELVDQTWCDLNGQPYRSEEFGYALTRVGRHFLDASDFEAPADCWGDLGAATGPLLLLLALMTRRGTRQDGPHHLVWTSSDAGERSAVLLRVDPVEEAR